MHGAVQVFIGTDSFQYNIRSTQLKLQAHAGCWAVNSPN